MTVGLEDTEIVVGEDVGAVEVCARVLNGDLDREMTVALTTTNNTAVGKSYLTHEHVTL